MSRLRDRIVGGCRVCGGEGYEGDKLCNCVIKFRVYNRLVDNGFNEGLLDLVSSAGYSLPMMESGSESVNHFLQHPFDVMNKGLSLYILSKENGRGKTTLAHYLVYVLAWPFAQTENYNRRRTYAFADMHTLLEAFLGGADVQDVWKATVLVLDDLGSESRSATWKIDTVISMLHRILHYRRDKKLPTIITSNFPATSLTGFYNGVLDSVLEIRPDGIIGGQVFRQVEVGGGEDFRLAEGVSDWPT